MFMGAIELQILRCGLYTHAGDATIVFTYPATIYNLFLCVVQMNALPGILFVFEVSQLPVQKILSLSKLILTILLSIKVQFRVIIYLYKDYTFRCLMRPMYKI